MKKIICILLSALMICTSFAISAFAAASYPAIGENAFKLNTNSESAIIFEVKDAGLSDITVDYFDKAAFDTSKYDATFYGAYKASLTIDDNTNADFTAEMTVSLAMNESYAEKDVFVFYITPENTVSEKIPLTRDGNTIKISGENFEKMADRIIVVMTGEEIAAPASPLIPAAICVGVAVIAIVISIIVVKRKKASAGIVE